MLKMYVWEGVMRDYKAGLAVALAHSPEEAAELVKKKIGYELDSWDGVRLDGVEPKEVTAPEGFYVYGGG